MSHLRPMRGEVGGLPDTVESLRAENETLRRQRDDREKVVAAARALFPMSRADYRFGNAALVTPEKAEALYEALSALDTKPTDRVAGWTALTGEPGTKPR